MRRISNCFQQFLLMPEGISQRNSKSHTKECLEEQAFFISPIVGFGTRRFLRKSKFRLEKRKISVFPQLRRQLEVIDNSMLEEGTARRYCKHLIKGEK